jgi:ribonucleoside-diphosphate reductase alpha chain
VLKEEEKNFTQKGENQMTMITKELGNRELPFDGMRLRNFIKTKLQVNDVAFEDKVIRSIETHETFESKDVTDLLKNTALENIDEASPHWMFIAAKVYLLQLYKEASKNRSYDAQEKYDIIDDQ